jgi:hypothetical protein
MPRRISEPKGDVVIREWRELHDELHNLCFSYQGRYGGWIYGMHGKDERCITDYNHKI